MARKGEHRGMEGSENTHTFGPDFFTWFLKTKSEPELEPSRAKCKVIRCIPRLVVYIVSVYNNNNSWEAVISCGQDHYKCPVF